MDGGGGAARSPSLNGHSNGRLIEIADRVVEDSVCNDVYYFQAEEESGRGAAIIEDDDKFEFDFGIVARDSARFWPIYPVFGRDLIDGLQFRDGDERGNGEANLEKDKGKAIRLPLRKLFIDERETAMTSSCSSSETDDLDRVAPDTYCVWRPNECNESSSTGSHQKRWRLKVKELLHRSHSDVTEHGVVFIGLNGGSGGGENRTSAEPLRRRCR